MAQHTKQYRFKDTKTLFYTMFLYVDQRGVEPCFELTDAVKDFDRNRKRKFATSLWKGLNECMSTWCP